MTSILYVNGPNLNLLGTREPELYGTLTLDDIHQSCRDLAGELGVALVFAQSNSEGALVNIIQEARGVHQGIIINAAGYSHTSIAILDALYAFEGKVIEVHLSNIYQREAFRHHSYISRRADGVIVGLGAKGYCLALRAIVSQLR